MRSAPASIALIYALLLYPAVGVWAQVIVDNGTPPDRGFVAYPLTDSVLADDFELTQSSVIAGIRFYTLERSAGSSGSIWWSIHANEAGEPAADALAGGLTADVGRVFTGVLNDNFKNGAQVINSIDITPLPLSAGHYWLLLHNGPLTNDDPDNAIGFLLWEGMESVHGLAALRDAAPFDVTWSETFGDRAFSLIGVPEPGAALILMAGLILIQRARH